MTYQVKNRFQNVLFKRNLQRYTTDEFENGNILDVTYPNVASALTLGKGEPASVAVVTGWGAAR
jgi:hypothetical protein